MNFWMNSKNNCAKNENEINEWINISRNILGTNGSVTMLLLQECSYRLYTPSFGNSSYDNRELCNKYMGKEIRYIEIPNKGSRWGLINEIQGTSITCSYVNDLSLLTCNYRLENNEIITVINLYANNSNGYHWDKILKRLNTIINENYDHLIILAGDFNASEYFPHNGIEEDRKIFQYIKNELDLVDCSENIPINERSTMIDSNYNNGYGFQNDYVFINKLFSKNDKCLTINKDKNISQYNYLFDHYPLDFKIIL
jgi:hypothetical protein